MWRRRSRDVMGEEGRGWGAWVKGEGNSHVTGSSWSVDGKRETHNLKGMIDTDTGLLSERTGPLEPCSHSYIYHRAGQLQHCRVTILSWLYRVTDSAQPLEEKCQQKE